MGPCLNRDVLTLAACQLNFHLNDDNYNPPTLRFSFTSDFLKICSHKPRLLCSISSGF